MSKPCYVYAVTGHDQGSPLELSVAGLADAPVKALAWGNVAALVSAYEDSRVRSSRANLSAHESVVEAARRAGQTVVLPMRFGVVVASPGAVIEDYLKPNQLRLSRLLVELAGKVEYRLTVKYLGDTALRQVVGSSRRIQRLQSEIRTRTEASTYHARIELGELVAAALEEVKANDARYVLERLTPGCVAYDVLTASGERVALRAALLLDSRQVDDFQRAVDQVARESQGRLELALVGPLAPWDFVDLEPSTS